VNVNANANAAHLITAVGGVEGHGSGLMRFAPALLIVTADSASATSFAELTSIYS